MQVSGRHTPQEGPNAWHHIPRWHWSRWAGRAPSNANGACARVGGDIRAQGDVVKCAAKVPYLDGFVGQAGITEITLRNSLPQPDLNPIALASDLKLLRRARSPYAHVCPVVKNKRCGA
jgi:hypothetical protein